MIWAVAVLFVIFWVLGIAVQTQDFIVDDSAPDSGSQHVSYKLEGSEKPAPLGLREPLEC